MTQTAIADITSTLNNDRSLLEKRNKICEGRKKRRGVNRHVYLAVEDMLSNLNLPIRPEDELNIYVLSSAPEEVYNRLKSVYHRSTCNYFNAVCGEVLWEHFHDKSFADVALSCYWRELEDPSANDEYFFVQIILSISRIYSKYRARNFDYPSFCNMAIAYVLEHLNETGYYPLFIIRALLKCKTCLPDIENTLKRAIEYYREINDHNKSIDYMECLEQHYVTKKCSNDVQILRCEMAKEYEKNADTLDWSIPANAHAIIQQIHNAMNMWQRANVEQSATERQRLSKRILPIKQLALEKMQYIQSETIDLTSSVEHIRTLIKNSSFEQIIANLAYIIPLQTVDGLKSKIEQEGFMLSSLFATTVIDEGGRIRCIIPAASNPSSQEKYFILEHRAAEEYTMIADAFIKRYIWIAKESISFTAENLRFLVENNAFIPPDRSDSFLKGLLAGFDFDLVTAMSILMPQIENAVRCLAEECGAVVYKTLANGVEECLSMESILKLPEIVECLDEDFLFNLKLFFTSDYGYGMRNIVSHGLDSDKAIQSASCLAVWWFVLHICCLFSPSLHNRLCKQHAAQKEDIALATDNKEICN